MYFSKTPFVFAISNIETGRGYKIIWDRITVKATSGEDIENITAVLINNGVVGMEIIDADQRVKDLESLEWDFVDDGLLVSDGAVRVVFYVPQVSGSEKMLCKIESELMQLGVLEVKRGSANESEWQDEWKKHFKPIKIGGVVIVPEWDDYEAGTDETVFRIDPGAAFGTGQHETTQLSLLALKEFVKAGDFVLDIGCGSGILSCISSLLGAKKIVACDIDPIGAINATRRNAELNCIDNIEIYAGDILSELAEKLSTERYDVVVANIVADVIVKLTPFVKGILKTGGKFISSGIIGERVVDVRSEFLRSELEIIWEEDTNDWHAFVVRKNA